MHHVGHLLRRHGVFIQTTGGNALFNLAFLSCDLDKTCCTLINSLTSCSN